MPAAMRFATSASPLQPLALPAERREFAGLRLPPHQARNAAVLCSTLIASSNTHACTCGNALPTTSRSKHSR